MNRIFPNVRVISSPVFELLASMFRLQSHEQLFAEAVAPIPQDLELELWVERVRKELPNDVKEALGVFFHIESYIGLSMVRFAWENNMYHSIEVFISYLKETPAHTLFAKFLQTGYVPEEIVDPYNLPEIRDFIKKSNLPKTEKWKLAYLYLDIEHTKERFIQLLSECFDRYFKAEWPSLAARHQESMTQLMKELKTRDQIKERFTYIDHHAVEDEKTEMVLSPSVFYHSGSLSSYKIENALFINLYGIYYSGIQLDQDKLIESFKILSDEKRIKMIKILSRGAYYGYELAQKLNLSNSTVSHHLSVLSSIGIVTSKRIENRVYYEVHKDKIAELMQAITKTLSD